MGGQYVPERHRPLRIAEIAPLWASVPPADYAGGELVIHWLTEELVRRGHDVTLFTEEDRTHLNKKIAAALDHWRRPTAVQSSTVTSCLREGP